MGYASFGWLECEWREMGRHKNMLFGSAGVSVYYFNDIYQGALQSDCVMLLRDNEGCGIGDDVAVRVELVDSVREGRFSTYNVQL